MIKNQERETMGQEPLLDISGTRPFIAGEGPDYVAQRLDTISRQSYTLTFEDGPDYLFARVCAETVSLEAASEYMYAIATQCRSRGQSHLLIERDVPVAMPMAHMISIVENMTSLLFGIKVAFVNPYREIDDRMEFLILAATNRGTDVSVHPTIEAARDWLAAG